MHSKSTSRSLFLKYGLILLACSFIGQSRWLRADDNKDSSNSKSLAASFVNSMSLLNDDYKLGPGDQLSFRVIEDEDPAKHLAIVDSGEVDVPYLGRLNVAGRTCKTVANEIKSALEKQYYIRATVILCLDTMAPKGSVAAGSKGKIYLMGQVRQQGPQEIPAEESYTVSKAVLRAGGFGEYANKRKVKLIRQGAKKGSPEIKIIDLVEVLDKGKADKDVVVEPEDLIVVPERAFNF